MFKEKYSMNYNELISRFEVFDNPPQKDGFDRHHIVPESEQKRLYGSVTDNRQIYVTPAQHLWAHVLYDKEHGTQTAFWFLTLCGKLAEYFDCWEKCLAYSYTLRKKKEEGIKKLAEVKKTPEHRQKLSDSKKGNKNPNYGKHPSEETIQKVSDSLKGKPTWMKGKHHSEETKKKMADIRKGLNTWSKGRKWFNDGAKNVVAYECPEGFVEGRLSQRRVV